MSDPFDPFELGDPFGLGADPEPETDPGDWVAGFFSWLGGPVPLEAHPVTQEEIP